MPSLAFSPFVLGAACLVCAGACASTASSVSGASPAAPPPAAPSARSAAPQLTEPGARCAAPSRPGRSQPPIVIAPAERVPEFWLTTEACDVVDSRELVGKQPFVVVFFASWCSVCEHRVPALRAALAERAGQVAAVWVSLDDPRDGWAETDAFLARHALAPRSAVAGREYLRFSLGYNPFRSVPVVVVVGRSGRVVNIQIGAREGDDAALEQALDVAIDQQPERSLFTSSPRP